jgi:hypothetical protein
MKKARMIRRKNNMATKGIDVSVWQGAIDFNAVRNSGVDFVIIRAGYGTNSKDKYFEENYRKAKAAGFTSALTGTAMQTASLRPYRKLKCSCLHLPGSSLTILFSRHGGKEADRSRD